jgi:hypothetical protein
MSTSDAISADRAAFSLGMAQLNDLTKICSEYIAKFSAPSPDIYRNGGEIKKSASPTSVFETDSSVYKPSSEYDSKYATPDVSDSGFGPVRKVGNGAKKIKERMNLGPYDKHTSQSWTSEYDSKYLEVALSDRPKPAYRQSLPAQAALEASRRKHSKSYKNVMADAATKAKAMADKLSVARAQKLANEEAKSSRPQMSAAISEAVAVAARKVPQPVHEFVEKEPVKIGSMVSTYNDTYKMPDYLRALANAAEAAKEAALLFSREKGKCSEYIGSFTNIDTKEGSSKTAGAASRKNDGGASSAMDWEQELTAVNDKSAKKGSARKGWASEYDSLYTDSAVDMSKFNALIAGKPSGVDDGGANGAMDWEATATVESPKEPTVPMTKTGWGESESHTEFKEYDVSAMATIRSNTTRASSAASDAMDWSKVPEKKAVPEKVGIPEHHTSTYLAAFGDSGSKAARSESEDWVLVDKKDTEEVGSKSSEFGSSTYSYGYNGGWKKQVEKSKPRFTEAGIKAYGKSEYDTNFVSPEEVYEATKEKREKKRVKSAPRNKFSVRSTVLDVPKAFRQSEYSRQISRPARGRTPKATKTPAARGTAGIFSMAPRYPDVIPAPSSRPSSEYSSAFANGKFVKIPAMVKLRMNRKPRFQKQ